MSLQAAAQHMASQGRGPDTTLVHMSPKEVRSLQELAMAHGGSLSVNPQTGLPEAGFLSSLLPMLIGAGLTAATGGAAAPGLMGLSNAATIGLGVGGLQALRTGSLKKGLMAGLGAYGGAGLMGSVMGAGTGAIEAGVAPGATSPIVNPAAPAPAWMTQAPPATPTLEGFIPDATNYGPGGIDLSRVPVTPNVPPTVGNSGLLGTGTSGIGAGLPPELPPFTATNTAAPMTPPTRALLPDVPNQLDIASDKAAALREAGPTGRFTRGIEEIGKDPSKFLTTENLKYGLTAAAPLVGSMFETKTGTPPPVDREQMRFAFDPGRLTPPTRTGDVGEYTYFRPSYTRLAAKGGLMDLYAEGGETEPAYTYDPETQLYSRAKSAPQQARASSGVAGPYMMGAPDADANGFQNLTPAQQAAFFAENPAFSPISQLGQQVMSRTTLGMLQAALNPNIASRAASIAQGINPDIADPSMESAGLNPGDTGISAATEAAGSGPSTAGSDSPGEKRGGIIRRAAGGISHLGDYSDGGRLLRGPGDGVSDSIPATIANKRPARLADGEFVVPARIVSELGNGSTEAGARKLYAMMDRIQKNRTKSVGKGKVAVNSRSEKLLPA